MKVTHVRLYTDSRNTSQRNRAKVPFRTSLSPKTKEEETLRVAKSVPAIHPMRHPAGKRLVDLRQGSRMAVAPGAATPALLLVSAGPPAPQALASPGFAGFSAAARPPAAFRTSQLAGGLRKPKEHHIVLSRRRSPWAVTEPWGAPFLPAVVSHGATEIAEGTNAASTLPNGLRGFAPR